VTKADERASQGKENGNPAQPVQNRRPSRPLLLKPQAEQVAGQTDRGEIKNRVDQRQDAHGQHEENRLVTLARTKIIRHFDRHDQKGHQNAAKE
jgi:hypothetical protein